MRRVLPLIGVCVLLLSVQIEAKKSKNQKNFWPLWPTEAVKTAASTSGDDFTLEEIEGSGTEVDIQTDNDKSNIHEDDEDFDNIGSGDGDFDGIDKDDIDLDTNDEFYDDYEDDKIMTTETYTDDEDLIDGSGSGGGLPEESTEEPEVIVMTSVPEPEATTERTPLTPCMQLRAASLNIATYVPVCDDEGEFKRQQCQDDKVNKHCWCVDPNGKKIKGTMLKFPTTPDCDFGTNLTTCVFQLVQNSQGLIGNYKPECTQEGEYESLQCLEAECWCVDKMGFEKPGSMRTVPEIPDCSEAVKPPKKSPKTPSVTKLPPTGYIVPATDTNIIVSIEETEIIIDNGIEQDEEDTNEINDSVDYKPQVQETRLLAKPGLLAAVIGGAVVGLLCMVLLVMFIVYRMRKKDEGSYALEEQKYQNYSYAKAPDKEFYA